MPHLERIRSVSHHTVATTMTMSLQCFLLLLLLLFPGTAVVSQNIVKNLPGSPGELPFKLETGYVSVGDIEFYYFVESQDNPGADPLILYINGGPGCSGLNGFFYQVGPLVFNTTDYTGGLPTLLLYPYSWTNTANIIFLDAPVGAGFSYATTTQAYASSDSLSAIQTVGFLRNWLNDHPDFKLNPFFMGTDSYAGKLAPIIVQEIMDGNEAGEGPHNINIRGYVIGSPHTDNTFQDNAKIAYAHRMALISDSLYEAPKTSCNGWYVDVDPSNAKCLEAIESIDLCIDQINTKNILDPKCAWITPKQNKEIGRSLRENSKSFILPSHYKTGYAWCQNFENLLSYVWGNDRSVQKALYGTVKEFFRCNNAVEESYTQDVDSAFGYHKNLTKSGLQVLVYSGDHDMLVTHVGTEQWIKALNISIDSDWRPWFVDGQVAGYTRTYENYGYRLTYSITKGAGHSPTEYKRRECYEMFYRWIHLYPL